ncbi:MAG: hypothetical protein NZ920_03830 [Aigarchaeota archaeon]|nr:hypothetical protein [Aigarchaeota archaeon]MDW8092250.1 hypothetical protein [Nitrososphaerota archaeon]
MWRATRNGAYIVKSSGTTTLTCLSDWALTIRPQTEEPTPCTPHTFRIWYRTTLEAARVNRLLIDVWMGHNSGVEKTYYLPTPEIIKQEFEKADKAFRIFGQTHTPPEADKAKALEEAGGEKSLSTFSRLYNYK